MASFPNQSRAGGAKPKNLVNPVKPRVGGKTIGEAMKGNDSFSSSTSGLRFPGFESDEGSLGSADNLLSPAPPSNEGSGILGMFSSFSRLTKKNDKAEQPQQRVGELPNKSKLQERASAEPIRPQPISQNSGTFDFNWSPKTPIQPTKRSSTDAPNSAPTISKPLIDDDDFFAELDRSRPSTSKMQNLASLPEDETKTDLKPKRESRTTKTEEKEEEIDGWLPIVAKNAFKKSRPVSTMDSSDHSASSLAAKNKPLSKDTMLAQEQARKQQEELARIMAQTAVTMEDLDDLSVHTNGSRVSHLKPKAVSEGETSEDFALRRLRQLRTVPSSNSESDEEKEVTRPKTKQERDLEEAARRQREQIDALIQSTPDVEAALGSDKIVTKKERKRDKQKSAAWHDVTADVHARKLTSNTNSSEESEEDSDVPETKESRRLKKAEQKRLEDLRATLQSTPDADDALETTKIVSGRERKRATKSRGSWVEIDKSKTREQRSQQELLESEVDKPVTVSRADRKLEQASRKQREQAKQRRLDSKDATEALDAVQSLPSGKDTPRRSQQGDDKWHSFQAGRHEVHKDLERKGNYSITKNSSPGKTQSTAPTGKPEGSKTTRERKTSRSSEKSTPVPRKTRKSKENALSDDALARQFKAHARNASENTGMVEDFGDTSQNFSVNKSLEGTIVERHQTMDTPNLPNNETWQGIAPQQHPFGRLDTSMGNNAQKKQPLNIKQQSLRSQHSGNSSLDQSHVVDSAQLPFEDSGTDKRKQQLRSLEKANENSSSGRRSGRSSDERTSSSRRSRDSKESPKDRKRSRSRKKNRKAKKNQNFGWERVSTHSRSQADAARQAVKTPVHDQQRSSKSKSPRREASKGDRRDSSGTGDSRWHSLDVSKATPENRSYSDDNQSRRSTSSSKHSAIQSQASKDEEIIKEMHGTDDEHVKIIADVTSGISIGRHPHEVHSKYESESSNSKQPNSLSGNSFGNMSAGSEHDDEARIVAQYGADASDLATAPENLASTSISIKRNPSREKYDSVADDLEETGASTTDLPRKVYDDESRIKARYGLDDEDTEDAKGAAWTGIDITQDSRQKYGHNEPYNASSIDTNLLRKSNVEIGTSEQMGSPTGQLAGWKSLEVGAAYDSISYNHTKEPNSEQEHSRIVTAEDIGVDEDELIIAARYGLDDDDLAEAPGVWTGISLGHSVGTAKRLADHGEQGENEHTSAQSTSSDMEEKGNDTVGAARGSSKAVRHGNVQNSSLATNTAENANIHESDGPNSTSQSNGKNCGPFDTRPELNPFAYRPPSAGPFASRPNTTIGGSEDPDSSSDKPEDLVVSRVSARRSELRQKVDDRREALTSMLSLTRQSTWSTENELLDLKRKLAISQALVQKLEIENAALQRKCVLDYSKAELVLLEQRATREQELEGMIQVLMNERNAAVLESHELRILITGSCETCKKRFNNMKEYAMDHSIRNTILEKRKLGRWSAFEWFAGNLAGEAEGTQSLTAEEVASRHGLTMDSIPIRDLPNAGFKPLAGDALNWISGKLNAVVTPTSNEDKSNTNHEAMETGESSAGPFSEENRVEESSRSEQSEAATNNEEGKQNNNFLSGLEAEQVQDEFSALHIPLTHPTSTARNTKPKKSFFSSLFGERVDEESTFKAIDPSLARRADESEFIPKPVSSTRFGFGLKTEKVLDDMEILNILGGGASEKPKSTLSENKPKTRSFGLGDEQLDNDSRDQRLLAGQSVGSKEENGASTKKSNLLGLRQEKFDSDDHDAQLLDLLRASEHGNRAKTEQIGKSKQASKLARTSLGDERVNDDDRDAQLLSLIGSTHNQEDQKLAPTATSKKNPRGETGSIAQISSPFAVSNVLSPRRTPSTNKGRRGSSAINYKGKFSPNKPSSVADPRQTKLDQLSMAAATYKGPIGRQQRTSMANHVPVDVEIEGARPWRNDSGGTPSSFTLPSIDAIDESLHSLSDDNDDERRRLSRSVHDDDDDLDRFAALLAAEET